MTNKKRFARAQARIQKGRDLRKARHNTFLRKLIPRKTRVAHLFLMQREWRQLEHSNRVVAQALHDMGIARTGFCCSPFKRAGSSEAFVSYLLEKGIVRDLFHPYYNLPVLLYEGQITGWDCHENAGFTAFTKEFLHWIQEEDISYHINHTGSDPRDVLEACRERMEEVLEKF